jgi:hypothetical protein
MQLGRRFSHAVIAAPQEHIEHGFVHRDYQCIAFPDHAGVASPRVQVPKDLIWGARQSQLGSVRRLLAYLRQPGPLDHALACTHAALNHLTAETLPADLSGMALLIDEAHHASADGLSEIVSLWRRRSGQLFFFTATPYRGDARPVALDGMRLFRRSLAEHMAEGFAPSQFDSEIVAIGQPGDVITGGVWTGEEAPPNSDKFVAAICRRWLEDGKPKGIVRVPPMQDGKSGELVAGLLQALTWHGARVLDATGTKVADKKRFLAALKVEQTLGHADSKFDVMVGIQRVLEGTDWPVCSAVYCVGMPGSLNTVVQFLGRAMRLKSDDYPAEHRDRARLVFFVPCAGGTALADLSIDHSRHALLTCCFLADHEVGQEWIVLREIRRGIEAALGNPDENSAAADAENEAAQALEPEIRAEIELVMANAREQIVADGGEPTLGEVVEWAAKTRPDLPQAAFHRVAAEILAAQTTSTGEAVREAIHEQIATRLRIDPMVKQAMAEAFAVVLEEFRDVTLKDSAALESVGRQIHGVTGGQMREFAQRLRDAAPRPLTEEQILAWADAHHERVAEWPMVHSGAVTDTLGETWSGINAALGKGSRGLPGGTTLPRLIAEHRNVRNPGNLPNLTVEQVLAWADAHHRRMGDWPNLQSGAIPEEPGEKWANINAALRNGHRGFSDGSSLAQLLAEHRGARSVWNLPQLSIDDILRWADAHRKRADKWPGRETGPIAEALGETWMNVDAALKVGLRGLPGGSSLAQLLAGNRDVRNKMELPKLTVDQILTWADAHLRRTGKWPMCKAGPIADAPHETWRTIDCALSRGLRGLSSGSSLAQLLMDYRGVRKRKRPPELSIEQILVWCDSYHEGTGKWPIVLSGLIDDAPGETWTGVDQALGKGQRGLPGGSSLAKLLVEHRGVRNRNCPPILTIGQILIWADGHRDRTGRWPTVKYGPVINAPDETWSIIDGALREGLRGLTGGSSLARLIKEHRAASVP